MSYYKNHMFIYTNQKDNGKQCCANKNAAAMLDYAKQQAAALGLSKESRFRISSAGCMGRCAQGPVLAVYPQGTWYTYDCEEDIDQILQAIKNGQIYVQKLVKEL